MPCDGLPAWTCLDGENACPPEEVGGVAGYQDFLGFLQGKSDHDTFFSMADALAWAAAQIGPTNKAIQNSVGGFSETVKTWDSLAFSKGIVNEVLKQVQKHANHARRQFEMPKDM